MKKIINIFVIAVTVLSFGSAINETASAATISHSTVPKKLRGTWYEGKTAYQFNKHSIKMFTVNSKGQRITKKQLVLSSAKKYKKRFYHMHVTKNGTWFSLSKKDMNTYLNINNSKERTAFLNKHAKRWWYNLPDMKTQGNAEGNRIGFTDGWGAWTYKKKIKGHKQTVMSMYSRQGYVQVLTKHFENHDYSYQQNGSLAYWGYKK